MVAGCALAYLAAFIVQAPFSDWLHFEPGVDWVFLPSGLRLCLVLLLPWPGAIGVALASAGLAWNETGLLLEPAVTGLISGFAPLLARAVALRWLGLDANLQALSGRALLGLVVVFALLCSTLHQLWYGWLGRSEDHLASLLVMFTGDVLGSLICLYALFGGIRLWARWHRRRANG